MPADLPGFYYDREKNRYFPIKGSIPGASKRPFDVDSGNPAVYADQGNFIYGRAGTRTVELLRERELCGNAVTSRKRKVNVQEELFKRRACQPTVWKYGESDNICGAALQHMRLSKLTPEGQEEADVILAGCSSGTLSLLEVEQVGMSIDYGVKCIPEDITPHNMEGYPVVCRAPLLNRRSRRPEVCMPSTVSSLKIIGKDSRVTGAGSVSQKVLLTTTGSETSPGSVYILNFSGGVDNDLHMWQQMHEVASFDCTVWTADCAPNGYEVVIGTNLGARLVNLECGRSSWFCRSKSDVLSQQFDLSGNIILCGLRNGAIVSFDIRQKGGSCARLASHKIFYPHSTARKHTSHAIQKRNWFEIKGNVNASRTIFMPSSISSLVLLSSYDQYFLASSMNGLINLYDRRMNKKEVQSYMGHVNSHTRIQLGVDPSDTFIMSGGEDSYMRIWDIKGGKPLYAAKFMSSVPSTLCWPKSGITTLQQCGSSSGAWIGSKEGLYLMLWP